MVPAYFISVCASWRSDGANARDSARMKHGRFVKAILTRAILWALSGWAIGVVLWALIGGTVWIVLHPMPTVHDTILAWPISILGTGIWATFIGAVAAPAYALVLIGWQLLLRRWPTLDGTTWRRLAGAAALGASPALLLTYEFASGAGFPFDWRQAAWVFPVAMVSCSGAVFLPRLFVPTLRQQLGSPAAQRRARAS